jgi:hypothetical protein
VLLELGPSLVVVADLPQAVAVHMSRMAVVADVVVRSPVPVGDRDFVDLEEEFDLVRDIVQHKRMDPLEGVAHLLVGVHIEHQVAFVLDIVPLAVHNLPDVDIAHLVRSQEDADNLVQAVAVHTYNLVVDKVDFAADIL